MRIFFNRTYLKVGCLTVFLLITLYFCNPFFSALYSPSAQDKLATLAGIPVKQLPTQRIELNAVIRPALLQQLPLGSTLDQAYTFLRTQDLSMHPGTPIDDEYLAFYRPLDEKNTVFIIIQEDLWRLTFPCRATFVITLSFDAAHTLQDVVAKDESACL